MVAALSMEGADRSVRVNVALPSGRIHPVSVSEDCARFGCTTTGVAARISEVSEEHRMIGKHDIRS